MRRLRILRKADAPEALDLRIETIAALPRGPDDVLVAVRAAGVNRSDVSAALGRMPQAVWPRTPGRDWAGVVIEGPDALVGQEAFGTGGDLGISRDGTHASHLVVHRDAVVAKPAAMALAAAGAIGVPFATALAGFHRAGMPGPGDVVLVLAANGMVGQAAAQIAAMLGARVFGVTRRREPFAHAHCAVRMIDASAADASGAGAAADASAASAAADADAAADVSGADLAADVSGADLAADILGADVAADILGADVAATVRAATAGHGADIVFNTVGSPCFAAANQAMAHGGRQILISTVERSVPFDIFAFYRGRHSFIGIDSLALDARASAALLRELLPGFASGALRPFPLADRARYPLERAKEAYRAVQAIARDRVVLVP
jgi:NADPH:quinone reductase